MSLDGSVSVGWRFLELSVAAQNLTDRRNRVAKFNQASSFGAGPSMRAVRHFAAGPPRTLLATLTLHADTAWLTGADE